jgi:hypothetical protein
MNHHRPRPLTYLLLALGCVALAVLGWLGAGIAGSAAAAGEQAPQADTRPVQGILAHP